MKMTWRVQLEDGVHNVELQQGFWSDKSTVLVRKHLVDVRRKVLLQTCTHCFHLNGHEVAIHLSPASLGADLAVDGVSQATGRAARWAKSVSADAPTVTARPGEAVVVKHAGLRPQEILAIDDEMFSLIHVWGWACLAFAAWEFFAKTRPEYLWATLLAVLGVLPFFILDAALFPVYAVALVWSAAMDFVAGNVWIFAGMAKLVFLAWVPSVAIQQRRRLTERLQKRVSRERTSATPPTVGARLFPGLAAGLGVLSFTGTALAVVLYLTALITHQRYLPPWFGALEGADYVSAFVALGLSVGALQANRERKFLAAIGIVTSCLVLLLELALIIMERGNYWT